MLYHNLLGWGNLCVMFFLFLSEKSIPFFCFELSAPWIERLFLLLFCAGWGKEAQEGCGRESRVGVRGMCVPLGEGGDKG